MGSWYSRHPGSAFFGSEFFGSEFSRHPGGLSFLGLGSEFSRSEFSRHPSQLGATRLVGYISSHIQRVLVE